MRLSEMRQLLTDHGIQLTKSLGQNFLHDQNQLRRIVQMAELQPTDSVLEIGPGLGPLTEVLLPAARVLAIEKDQRLIPLLKEQFQNARNLELIHADALEYVVGRDWQDWKLIANLPYSVASPILVELAQSPKRPKMLVATLQLEVARRLMAQAGTADYGVLTLLVQLHYEPREQFKIPASCFFPEPDVDSACIKLVRRTVPLSAAEGAFTAIVKRSFSQRRKMMLKLLKQDWPAERLTAAFRELGISEQARAEQLDLQTFARLSDILSDHG
jgi:16S rRNA (adenine1518-N6/adenine1519-N6)-dimethyltransferase